MDISKYSPIKTPVILLFFTILHLLFSEMVTSISPESYWASMLPNTPMPEALKNLLITENLGGLKRQFYFEGAPKHTQWDGCFWWLVPLCKASMYKKLYDTRANLFFLEKDLQVGTKKTFQFIETSRHAKILRRNYADSIPFSSDTISEVLDSLHIKNTSPEAKEMRHTIDMCEAPETKNEDKSCATSFESMIDFTTSRLGTNVQILFSDVLPTNVIQSYSVLAVKDMKNEKAVVCHKQRYPYAVFNCHLAHDSKMYKVSMASEVGKIDKAVAICHRDTSSWDASHLAFDVLNVKPGSVSICHFLPGGHIVWIPR